MNTKKTEKFLKSFAPHILMVLSGLIMLLNPDGATALVTKLAGWIMVIWGAAKLIVPTIRKYPLLPGDWVAGGVLILVGVILLSKPLVLANLIGKFFGIILALAGLDRLRCSGFDFRTGGYLVAGALLFILPRTLTQTLFAIIGIALIIIGIVNILGEIRDIKRLDEPSDPNIIDADM